MFELFITLIFVIVVFTFGNYWVTMFAFFVLVLLVGPGMYAMLFGGPFIPTHRNKLEVMIRLAGLKSDDKVVELGCGDGRIIRAAAGEGVESAVGYEFSLPTYLLAKWKRFRHGRGESIKFGNFWKQDYSDVDVVFCFLLDITMPDFQRIVWPQLKPGARVVSNQFVMEGVEHAKMERRVYLYEKT